MNRDDWLLRLLIALLLAAMLATLFLGRKHSRHGYGLQVPPADDMSLYRFPPLLTTAEKGMDERYFPFRAT